ncbi:snakin-2-like [Cucurbita pepo subsp. pepo]|uniref:snakin-2-like n=1 Tax=Cucurbita pepo subsp. pepo TaxID=3664 RepID=UPI000C9D4F51|nr:snakin-2-like [Cucurbita pepo subsp. pepo]
MAISSKALIASLLLSLLFLHSVESIGAAMVSPSPQKMDCGGACAARCRLSSRQRLCHRACGTCCQRCNCVPPGTSGNHHMCPCYASLTTHGGRLKCP